MLLGDEFVVGVETVGRVYVAGMELEEALFTVVPGVALVANKRNNKLFERLRFEVIKVCGN